MMYLFLFAMKQKKRSDCPFSCSLDIWGDKWSLLIIRDMVFLGKNTYGDFLKSPEGIATNILATRLQQLEQNGLIEKTEHPDSKAKYLYKLTPKGIGLIPVLVEIYLWAEQYQPIPENIKNKLDLFKTDKEGMIRLLTEKLGGI
jgi:DNA-binding HxlR family transcriptional regulator